jgi:hypothetical protein
MVYVIQFCRQLASKIRMELHEFHPDPAEKLLMMDRGSPKHVVSFQE